MRHTIRLRIIAVVLASASLFLSSCAADPEPNPPGIVNATEGTEEYGKYLSDRIGTPEESVVLGVGDSAEYDVEMGDFEDDGYIIRRTKTDILLFGKTSDGLDRAVRKYANSVLADKEVTDVEYHKGYRIEKLTMFGADISEYVINYPEDYNANMEFAASELASLIKKATGAELKTEVGKSSAEHRIELRFSGDESLGNAGYRYYEEGGNLIIEGARARGCSNGVYRFLQNELNWKGLIFGDSRLTESDLIEINEGLSKAETPIFDYFMAYNMFYGNYVTDRTDIGMADERNSYGPVTGASHGMYNMLDTNVYEADRQPCYSSEETYTKVRDKAVEIIEAKIASNTISPDHIEEIDVSQVDNGWYCRCDLCKAQYAIDRSDAGAIVKFANRLGAELIEKYPDIPIAIKIFAYYAAKTPPRVTKAEDYVYVTYCTDGHCSNHYLDGSQCSPSEDGGYTDSKASNYYQSKWLEGWCEKAKNVYVWYYKLDILPTQYTIIDLILRDFQYMKSIGVNGLFWQIPYEGFGIKRTEQQLGAEVNWNSDMTEEEYEALLCELLEHEYGDGWEYVREYLDMQMAAQDEVEYFSDWAFWPKTSSFNAFGVEYMRQNWEKMANLLESAIDFAASKEQEARAKLLSCQAYYVGALSLYFKATKEGDEETLKKLNEGYARIIERIDEAGFNTEELMVIQGAPIEIIYKMGRTLDEEAEINWKEAEERLSN